MFQSLVVVRLALIKDRCKPRVLCWEHERPEGTRAEIKRGGLCSCCERMLAAVNMLVPWLTA